LEKLTQPHGISISIAFSGPSALLMFNSGTKNEITRFQNPPLAIDSRKACFINLLVIY